MRRAALHDAPVWRIRNARLPACLVTGTALVSDGNGLAMADLVIEAERIESLLPAGVPGPANDAPLLDLGGAILLPCLVDAHVHLDKGHIWPRAPNGDGTFASALASATADREANWSVDDMRTRMEFALACAYAHGTCAVRTHLDSIGPQTALSWPLFAQMRDAWRDRLHLQAVPLFGIHLALDHGHMSAITAALAQFGSNVLGAVTYMDPCLQQGLDVVFKCAADKGYDLDFHVDETKDTAANSLRMIAQTAIAHNFQGKILAGHCCSLAMQSDDAALRTIDLVARAGINVVSLPLCNMYLQDRQAARTPRWRGVTLLHELKAAGVPVMIASDNTRDPFHAYGDLDMLEVFREGTRTAHLDHPHGDWLQAVATTPAAIMGLAGRGALSAGGKADFIITGARNYTELLSRPQMERTIVRNGRPISALAPAYTSLDGGRGLAP